MSVYDIYGLTTTGPVRSSNEDHILVGRFVKNAGSVAVTISAADESLAAQGMVCAVADGVGGENGGAMASEIVIQTLETRFYGSDKTGSSLSRCREALLAAVERANKVVRSLQLVRPELGRMGCTLSGVCLTTEGFLVFNAGDSRVYRLRDGILRQLTRDDSVTAMAVNAGVMSPAEAEVSPARHTVANVAGSDAFKLQVAEGPEFRDGDALFLCTDGVHDLIPLEELESVLVVADGMDSFGMCELVCNEALKRGGRDNISLVIIRKVAGELDGRANRFDGKNC